MNRPNAPQVEKVAAEILHGCLIDDGSLLTSDRAIWTRENLADLHVRYVSAPDLSAKSFSEKHDVADRRMLDAAHLLRDMAVPAHEAGPVNLPALRDDAGTHRKLFEAAVRGFFRCRLSSLGWDVKARILRWTPLEHAEPPFLPVMKTDVTLDHPATGRRVIVETKFTDALVDRDGKTTIATGYLYQLYAYLASQTGRGDDTLDAAEGVLLFVKTADRDPFDGEVIIQGHNSPRPGWRARPAKARPDRRAAGSNEPLRSAYT